MCSVPSTFARGSHVKAIPGVGLLTCLRGSSATRSRSVGIRPGRSPAVAASTGWRSIWCARPAVAASTGWRSIWCARPAPTAALVACVCVGGTLIDLLSPVVLDSVQQYVAVRVLGAEAILTSMASTTTKFMVTWVLMSLHMFDDVGCIGAVLVTSDYSHAPLQSAPLPVRRPEPT